MSEVALRRIVTAAEVQDRLRKWADGELPDAELKQWARTTFARDDFCGETIGVDHVVEVLAGSRAHRLGPSDYATLHVALKSDDPERFMKRMVWGEPTGPDKPVEKGGYDPYDVPPQGDTRPSVVWNLLFGLAFLGHAIWAVAIGRVTDLEWGWFYRSDSPGEYWTLTLLSLAFGCWLAWRGLVSWVERRDR